MAVESQRLNFFKTAVDTNVNPFHGGTTTAESFVSMYNNSTTMARVADSFPANEVVKADSGLTYAHHTTVSRKRPADSINHCGVFAFLGEDVSLQIQQQQLEMDLLITQHNNEVRIAIEERRKRYSRRIIAAVEEGLAKRLKAKDDEIEKNKKLNWALQEKVKSLSVEGQIWRDLAHTNQAAAQALRANLEQVLAATRPNDNEQSGQFAAEVADDAESCCGSNYCEEVGEECGTRGGASKCRHCGEGVSSVLLLPCRHLCLCTVCGSSVHTCPVCKTPKTASVHVIMSG